MGFFPYIYGVPKKKENPNFIKFGQIKYHSKNTCWILIGNSPVEPREIVPLERLRMTLTFDNSLNLICLNKKIGAFGRWRVNN